MDIKLRKSKLVISFIAWFLGVVIILMGLFNLAAEYFRYSYDFKQRIKEVFEEDYQKTEDFEYSMSIYLNNFLSMSVNGPGNYSNYYYNTYAKYPYETSVVIEEAESVIGYAAGYEEAVDVAASAEEISIESETAFSEEVETPADVISEDEYDALNEEEFNKKDAQAYHDSIKNSRNMLYTIAHKGEILYTNDESLGLYHEYFTLPEGYNYVLYFDGEKAGAIKGGIPVDIYGDGIYENTDTWYIPGYQNFPVDESIKDSEICIALAEIPTIEVAKNYNESRNRYDNNIFYDIQSTIHYAKIRYIKWIYHMIAGFILLIIGIVMYKHKKEADKAIARFTGKIWFEIKLIPILAIGCYIIMLAIILLREIYWDGYRIFWNILEILQEAFYRDYGLPLAIVIFISFFFIWPFMNDVRHNDKTWRHSLSYKIISIYRTTSLRLPITRRMIRRCWLLFITEAILTFAAYLILIMMTEGNWLYEGDALILIGPAVLIIIVICQLTYSKHNKDMVQDIDMLVSHIANIHDGNILEPYKVSDSSVFAETFKDLNDIQAGMNTAMEEQMKSERMKVELIANVSHDIKTPLTSIISYVELLKQEEELPEHVKEYVSILESKAERLKLMVQDVFEVSKAASGELPINMENLDLGKLLLQTLADMSEQIESGNVTVKSEITESSVMIHADGERLYRVFQNLIQNALKYSLEGSRIYVTLQADGSLAVASVKNISKEEIPSGVDYTERFARGDKSRSDGGSGLGLSIAQSFTEACGGTFKIDIIADLFVVTVSFPEIEPDS